MSKSITRISGLKLFRFLCVVAFITTLAYVVYSESYHVVFILKKVESYNNSTLSWLASKRSDSGKFENVTKSRTKQNFSSLTVHTDSGYVICNRTVKPPDFQNLNERWQRTEKSYESHHVFSAYYHNVNSVNIIRIIGNIFQPAKGKKVYCLLWYNKTSGPSKISVTSAVVEPLPEAFHSRFRVSFFRCNLPDVNIPVAVSLTSQSCEVPKNLLPVRSSRLVAGHRYKRKFAVCVPPLHGQYNLTRELIQWIELNRILGADYFVFYNFSTSRPTDFVLQLYKKKGLVKVVDWNVTDFPPGTRDEMNYFGQHAAMNDCLMRMKIISEFSVNCDLDEILIPHSNCTDWNDIIRRMPGHGGYMFLHSFFRLNWNNTEKDYPKKNIAEKYHIWPLLKLKREKEVHRPKVRSKYFSRTDVTESVGTHEIFRMKSGHHVHTIPAAFGLVHHYRTVCTKINDTVVPDPVNNVPSIVDDTAYVKYRDRLIGNVMEIYSEINSDTVGKWIKL